MRDDCRHYVRRSTAGNERIELCRLSANESDPFACPDGCLFHEERLISDTGWQTKEPPKA